MGKPKPSYVNDIVRREYEEKPRNDRKSLSRYVEIPIIISWEAALQLEGIHRVDELLKGHTLDMVETASKMFIIGMDRRIAGTSERVKKGLPQFNFDKYKK